MSQTPSIRKDPELMLLIFILKWNQNILSEQVPFDLQFFLF